MNSLTERDLANLIRRNEKLACLEKIDLEEWFCYSLDHPAFSTYLKLLNMSDKEVIRLYLNR